MPKEFSRARRVGDQIQRELAMMMMRELKDPRIGMVTVSAVKVSKDLQYAKVFVTFLNKEADEIEEAMQSLDSAKGYLRSQLAREIKMRQVPHLTFAYDESIVRGRELSSKIDAAVASDKARHQDDEE